MNINDIQMSVELLFWTKYIFSTFFLWLHLNSICQATHSKQKDGRSGFLTSIDRQQETNEMKGNPRSPRWKQVRWLLQMDRWGNSTADQIFPSMGVILCVPYLLATSDLCSFLTERVKFLSSKAYGRKNPWKPLKSIMKKNKDKVEVCEVQDLLEQSNNWSILLYRCVCVYLSCVIERENRLTEFSKTD